MKLHEISSQTSSSKMSANVYEILILGSCLQVEPSPHNFNSDPSPPPLPPPIVKSNAFSAILACGSNVFLFFASGIL